jgi:hypothetical protein
MRRAWRSPVLLDRPRFGGRFCTNASFPSQGCLGCTRDECRIARCQRRVALRHLRWHRSRPEGSCSRPLCRSRAGHRGRCGHPRTLVRHCHNHSRWTARRPKRPRTTSVDARVDVGISSRAPVLPRRRICKRSVVDVIQQRRRRLDGMAMRAGRALVAADDDLFGHRAARDNRCTRRRSGSRCGRRCRMARGDTPVVLGHLPRCRRSGPHDARGPPPMGCDRRCAASGGGRCGRRASTWVRRSSHWNAQLRARLGRDPSGRFLVERWSAAPRRLPAPAFWR